MDKLIRGLLLLVIVGGCSNAPLEPEPESIASRLEEGEQSSAVTAAVSPGSSPLNCTARDSVPQEPQLAAALQPAPKRRQRFRVRETGPLRPEVIETPSNVVPGAELDPL